MICTYDMYSLLYRDGRSYVKKRWKSGGDRIRYHIDR